MDAEYYRRIEKWAPELKGVFSLSDLKVIFSEIGEPAVFKNLNSAVAQGILTKVIRGLYSVPGTSLEIISSRIDPESYISTGTVLAKNGLIGSIPGKRVQAVKIGRPRTYITADFNIEHLSISPEYFFGFETVDGIKYATPEKAFIDVCYYRFKGKTFSFDPATDVNLSALDSKRIKVYLQKYERRFIDFMNRIGVL